MKSVLEASKDHAEVLASFAIIYKLAVKILQNEAFLGPKTHNYPNSLLVV